MTTRTDASNSWRYDLDADFQRQSRCTDTDATRVSQQIRERQFPWRDEEILNHLYWEEKLSQSEIADRLGCDQSAISRWMDQLDIETRDQGRKPGLHPTFTSISGGYTLIKCNAGESCDAVGLHQLLACVDHDPHRVFDSETVVHHQVGSKKFKVQVDVPGALQVLTRSEHSRGHSNGELDAPEPDNPEAIDDWLSEAFDGFGSME